MILKGWNRACSNVGNAAGRAATINLEQISSTRSKSSYRRAPDRIKPDKLSKIYWSKWGLLGFFEMTPRIPTRRLSVRSKMGTKDPLAVTITLMTPNPNTKLVRVASNERKVENHILSDGRSRQLFLVSVQIQFWITKHLSTQKRSRVYQLVQIYVMKGLSVSKSWVIVAMTYSNAFPCLMNKIRSIVIAA